MVHCGLVSKQCWIRKSILHLSFVLLLRKANGPRTAMANWTAELKRLAFFCFDVIFENKTFISGGRL